MYLNVYIKKYLANVILINKKNLVYMQTGLIESKSVHFVENLNLIVQYHSFSKPINFSSSGYVSDS
jgi:hypothetical protein